MKPGRLVLSILAVILGVSPAAAGQRHNIILFVADGLRYGSVTSERTPNLAKVKSEGVDFTNSHSLYPTLTTVNASAIATGHYIGDTGDFGNVIYTGFQVAADHGSPVPFLEDDTILEEMNAHFGGNYVNEVSLLAAACKAGFETATIGKLGPTRIQALTAGSCMTVIDDATGHNGGFKLPPNFVRAMERNLIDPMSLPPAVPNTIQQTYFAKIATRVVLPEFKNSGKPFILVFWSRDPDYSQHATRDSIGELTPGIDGPTGEAGVEDADTSLGLLLKALKALGLDKTTDVFVTADHGFATITKASKTSPAAHFAGIGFVPVGDLPSGFLAVDVAAGLHLPLHDPNASFASVNYEDGAVPSHGSGYVGQNPAHPEAIVVPNGGAGLIYLPGKNAAAIARRIVTFMMKQDYVSGLFVNDRLGKIPGTLPMSAIGLMGSAKTPQPAIYVNFRSFATPCADPLMCTVEVADTPLKTGQGMHGSFSRAETRNFMAAIGPDFMAGYRDAAPVGNADIAPTLSHILGIDLPAKGRLTGRIITEALKGGSPVKTSHRIVESEPGQGGLKTVLDEQTVGPVHYFDAAGFPGRTLGLSTN